MDLKITIIVVILVLIILIFIYLGIIPKTMESNLYNNGNKIKLEKQTVKWVESLFDYIVDEYRLLVDVSDIENTIDQNSIIEVNYNGTRTLSINFTKDIVVKKIYLVIDSKSIPSGSLVTLDKDNKYRVYVVSGDNESLIKLYNLVESK